jgi:ABC-2 type transport system permease protein
MRHVLALAKRELISYILSPVGYVIAFLFIGLYLVFFYLGFSRFTDANAVLDNGIYAIYMLAIFAIPFLTMGLLADERRSGTIEMLMTAPVGDWEVVLGKYFASVLFILALVVPSVLELVATKMYGMPEWGPVISGYIGLALLVLFLVSMGLFFSSVSKSPLVAVMLSYVVFMALLIVGAVVPDTPAGVEMTGNIFANVLHYVYAFLKYASLGEHLGSFSTGLIVTRDVAYFGTGTVFFLFLSTLAVESRKWK